MMYTWHYLSPVGDLTMTGTESALTSLYFSSQKHLPDLLDDELIKRETEIFTKTKLYLDSYFEGKRPSLLPKIEIHTTPFRHKVYEILSTIGYGKTLTYGDIAKILIDKNKLKAMSSQAVGNAVGHNPICIIIPCNCEIFLPFFNFLKNITFWCQSTQENVYGTNKQCCSH